MIEELLEPLVPERFRTDERYRDGHVRIINALPDRKIMGVHIPELRALAKSLVRRDDARELIGRFEADGNLCHEELLVWGMMINAMKLPLDERLELTRRHVAAMDNWAVCDSFVAGAKWFGKAFGPDPALWSFLCEYFASQKEFDVRFATVMSMSYCLSPEWLPKVFDQFDALDMGRIHSDYPNPPYYVRMGVAWCLATALAKYPEQTRAYIHRSQLPGDVIRLYVRKSRESLITRHINPL